MLVLIAGITGHIGQHLARHAIAKGLTVRGLSRSPEKLDPSIKLESFIQSKNHYDIPALDAAVKGVDAIIVAYMGLPELQIDGQILLLRAAERAGVRIFHTATWAYDWRKTKLLEHEAYDPFVMFWRTAELTSPIKPIYMFSGVIAEVFFSVEGRADFSPRNGGVFDQEEKCLEYYGTGHEKYQWTTEEDAAKLSIEVIMSEEAKSGNGGFFSAWSGEHSVLEIAEAYKNVHGKPINLKSMGTVEDLEEKALAARAEGTPAGFWGYIGAFYQLFTINKRWVLTDENMFPSVERTSLEEFLKSSNLP
ncbi:NAD(P)-binding protein [Bimuria novae-zelandiae CBS 107.79]|uniref:NAD(P)-binding protein n=1 Tax=Bimuria novae-zelandiae CBS 107.79 TaxID=1447943 RepID=A0A6A5UWK5_9PLEO|nr:NAD(P)-binding protein [Bimuria novae-zelandiae CBS 107.79]